MELTAEDIPEPHGGRHGHTVVRGGKKAFAAVHHIKGVDEIDVISLFCVAQQRAVLPAEVQGVPTDLGTSTPLATGPP